jgi:hypothetical protein
MVTTPTPPSFSNDNSFARTGAKYMIGVAVLYLIGVVTFLITTAYTGLQVYGVLIPETSMFVAGVVGVIVGVLFGIIVAKVVTFVGTLIALAIIGLTS